MKIKVAPKIKSKSGLLVVPLFQDELKTNSFPSAIEEFVKARVKNDDFKAKKGTSHFTYLTDSAIPEKCLVIGLGKRSDFDESAAREIGAKIGKAITQHKCEELTIFDTDQLATIYQGIKLVQYKFDEFKSEKKKKDKELKLVNIVSGKKEKLVKEALRENELICEGVDFIKYLVNSPANVVDADYLARAARGIARENGYKVAVFGNKELKKMGAGGILAVNEGTKNDARLMVLEYNGGGRKDKPIILVGKGVIFDTGGINLKPTGHIETMQQDMAGGATVLGVMKILKKLKIKKHVVAVVPAVQNLISDAAYRPSDIIEMLSGNTVEVTNTDAEGRLILADALTYSAKMKPELMISIATLTGAVGVALGNRYCGILGNNKSYLRKLEDAGEEVDDLAWQLPIHEDYRKKMVSKVADFTNYDVGTGRYGGALKAAAFLEKFVDDKNWCHIDVGGTAFTNDPKPYEGMGATAHGYRMLINFLKKA